MASIYLYPRENGWDSDAYVRAAMLRHAPGLSLEQMEILREQRGKPYFPRLPHWHFSLSHSRNLVVVAIGKSKLGVDVEWLCSQ